MIESLLKRKDIPEQWKKNKSLMYASEMLGRPILSTDELTSNDCWKLLFKLLGVDKNKIIS